MATGYETGSVYKDRSKLVSGWKITKKLIKISALSSNGLPGELTDPSLTLVVKNHFGVRRRKKSHRGELFKTFSTNSVKPIF